MSYDHGVRVWSRACLALSGALLASPARAQAAPQVDLELESCTGLYGPAVRRILAAELGSKLAEAPGPGVTSAVVVCHGNDAELRVKDPLSRKAVTRHVDMGSAAPNARARLIAIATSELVFASWSELQTNPDPLVEPAGPPPPPDAREAARDWVAHRGDRETTTPPEREHKKKPERLPPVLLAVVSQRAFFRYPGALWGGGVKLGHEPLSHVAWSLDAVIDRGQLDTPLGRYEVETTTLGASLYLFYRWSWFTAALGGGLRAGVARSVGAAGAQAHGTSTIAPWGWPLATLSLTARPGGPLVFELSGETSYVLLPVSNATADVHNPTLSGMWYGIELGVGITL